MLMAYNKPVQQFSATYIFIGLLVYLQGAEDGMQKPVRIHGIFFGGEGMGEIMSSEIRLKHNYILKPHPTWHNFSQPPKKEKEQSIM